MPGNAAATEFPESLAASLQNPALRYRLVKSHFAIHGSARPVDATDAIMHFPAENIAVHASATRARVTLAKSDAECAVYESSPGGAMCVPTGRIFVRFATGIRLEDNTGALDRAGYRIVQSLSYAPNAGWVSATSGDVAASLAGIGRLDTVPGIEEVAPQMLRKAARKD